MRLFSAVSRGALATLLVAGCVTVAPPAPAPPPPATEVPRPPSRDARLPRVSATPVEGTDPLAGIVPPLVRTVAGRADTLVAVDLFGQDLAADWAAHPDVTVTPLRDGRLVVAAREGFAGLALVPFTAGGTRYVLPVEAAVEPEVTFRFAPDLRPGAAAPTDVFVIGAFNDWSRTSDRLTRQPDGAFALTRRVPSGRYEYKFTVDGAEVMDPARPDSVANPFGAYNNLLTVRSGDGGAIRLTALAEPYRGDPSLVAVLAHPPDGQPFEMVEPDDVADVGAAAAIPVVLAGSREFDIEAVAPFGDTLVVDLDALQPGPHRVRFAVVQGATVSNWIELPVLDARPWASAGALAAPSPSGFTWNDAVVYQVVLDRFRNGDPANDAPVDTVGLDPRANYHGGDLQGVLDAIEEGYFDGLNVNTLWLSPVYANPARAYREFPEPHRLYTGYHGYWPVAAREVDARLGSVALLREVVEAAHARGIRVLLDFVANHVHEEHPYFREHRDWFGTLELPDGSLNLRRWDDYRLTTWFEPYLPSFDYDAAPEAVDQVTADAVWWLRATGADGFRHDAVKHIPNGFWRALTARLRAEMPERYAGTAPGVYQIGETFGSHALVGSYVVPGQLDAQFNFNLYDAAIATLARGGPVGPLAAEVERALAVYGPLHVMGNPISSHDKVRFLALVEDDVPAGADGKAIGWGDAPPRVDRPASYRRMELAFAYLLTTPGVPVLYYGDEIGMTGADDPDNRRPMPWTGLRPEQERLREATAHLVALRNRLPALRHGDYQTLSAEGTVWTFRRTAPGSEVVVSLNTGDAPAEVRVAGEYPATGDVFTGETVTAPDGLRFVVPAGGYRIIVVR